MSAIVKDYASVPYRALIIKNSSISRIESESLSITEVHHVNPPSFFMLHQDNIS